MMRSARVRIVLVAVPATLCVAGTAGWAAPPPVPPPGYRGVVVKSLAVLPDGARDDVFTVESLGGCKADCVSMQRSTDGGRTFTRVAAQGWSQGSLVAVDHPALGPALLSAAPDGLLLSTDRGATFRRVAEVTGPFDAKARDARTLDVVVGGGARPSLVSLPAGTVRTLPATGLDRARLVLHPRYPDVPAGQPVAFAAGAQPDTGYPAVAACDAAFRCGAPVVVAPRVDHPNLAFSPSFATDRTVVVTLSQGGAFVSGDGARSFAPVVVAPPGAETLTTTVQAVAFTPDFDAVRRTGAVYAALLAVTGKPGEVGTTVGGVYRSADARSWALHGGSGAPDTGVTALAVARRDVVVAGFFALPDGGGVVCAPGTASWRPRCDLGQGARAAGGPAAAAPPPSRGTARTPAPTASAPAATAAARSVAAEPAAGRTPGGPGAAWPIGLGVVVAAAAGGAVAYRRRLRTW